MDTLCRVCIEKVAKCTSLSSKIEVSSNLSFFDFLNKYTTLNARENDSLPQSLCSVCANAMKTFYSFMKLAEKSDLILREAWKKLVAEGTYNGHKTPCENSTRRKKISPRKNTIGSSLYILDFVKEEPRVYESTLIVPLKDDGINESENFESNFNHPQKSNEEPDDVSSRRDRRLESIDTSELTDSENDIPTSTLKRKLAKSEDAADSQRNSGEEITITNETIEEESEDFNQGGSFHCQPSKNSTGSLPYMLDIVKEEPRVSESTSIVAVKDAVINESENLESNLDNPKGSVEELDDVLSCISRPASIDTEHADSEDDLPMSLLKKRLAKNGDEADSQRNSCEEIIRNETWHRCELCGKKFHRKKNLNNHLKNHKGIQKCDKCGKEFENIYRLRQHLFLHTDPLKHEKCEQCGKKLKHMHSLRRHMQLHTNPKPFKCEHCKKSFVKKSSCSNHSCYKRVYEKRNRKKFECEICGKKFCKDYLERYHMESHKGTISKCNQCGKEFKHKDSLSRHMKLHNNPKPFKCEICGQLFDRRYRYNSHIKICEHAVKQEQLETKDLSNRSKTKEVVISQESAANVAECKLCDKQFKTKEYFNVHMKKHMGFTYKCNKCDKKFENIYTLRRHMRLICKSIGNSIDDPITIEDPNLQSKENQK